ncbi:MAG: alcohol dehydrogenase [Trueperaceae bacterium]|nr:MAG: alcohol dehydrogenase [Trueperaceae bacterium]
MLALQKVATGEPRLELREVPEPTLRPGHVIIDVAAAGICGTDVHIMHDEYRSEPPVTLGHEVAGTIAAIGAGVDGWELGQRVVTETYYSVCGRCEHCRTGRPNLCASRRSIGSFEDGGFAPRVRVPATILHALPDDLGFPEAALVEPLACVVRGLLELNDVRAGDRVVITGPGPIGLLALQVAKAAGARVVVLGTAADAARLELAEQLGADGVLTVEAADALDEALAAALGGEPDVAIECSGAAPAAGLLLRLVKKAGRYVQVGLYGAPITLDMDQVCFKELRVSGSFATTPSSWYRALALASSGTVSLEAIVGATFALTDWERAFEAVAGRTPGKVLLVP